MSSDYYPQVAETDVEVPFSLFQHGATMTEYDPKICAGLYPTWLLFPGRKYTYIHTHILLLSVEVILLNVDMRTHSYAHALTGLRPST